MIEITIEGATLVAKALQDYPPRIDRAIVRATNRAMKSARTVIVRAMAKDTRLKSSTIREALTLREANKLRVEARLSAPLKRISLVKFGARQTASGVSYNLGRGTVRLRHAFIATMPLQAIPGLMDIHTGVFFRMTKKRLPIKARYGPSLGHVFAKFRPLGLARAEEVFRKNLAHEIEFANSELPEESDAGAD